MSVVAYQFTSGSALAAPAWPSRRGDGAAPGLGAWAAVCDVNPQVALRLLIAFMAAGVSAEIAPCAGQPDDGWRVRVGTGSHASAAQFLLSIMPVLTDDPD